MNVDAMLEAGAMIEVARDAETRSPLPEILLFPEGKTEFNGREFTLDAAAGAEVVERFRRINRALVVDWNHDSLANPQAMAAGWIEAMRYEPGRGVVGEVQWTEEARDAIRAGRQRYISPVWSYDKDTLRVRSIRSAALTLEPARGDLLLAAARAEHEARGGDAPPPATLNTGDNPMDFMERIREALGLGGEASEEEVLERIANLVSASKADTPPADEEAGAVANKVRSALGLEAKASADEVMVAFRSKVAANDGAAGRLAQAEATIAELKDAEATRGAKALVDEYVSANKINPHDPNHMSECLALAKSQPDTFKKLMDGMPAFAPPGRVTPEGPGPRGRGAADRGSLIAKASAEFDAADPSEVMVNRETWINGTLIDNKMKRLSEDEIAKLAV